MINFLFMKISENYICLHVLDSSSDFLHEQENNLSAFEVRVIKILYFRDIPKD